MSTCASSRTSGDTSPSLTAVATVWLLLTNPVTVATAVNDGEVSPLVRELARVFLDALAGLLKYL